MMQVGDTVAYLAHGVGTIERREERELLGETRECLEIRFHESGMTVVVPVEQAEKAGLRPVMDVDTAGRVVEVLGQSPASQGGTWSSRYARNQDKLKAADPMRTAEVVRDLAALDRSGKISSGEFGMLKRAKLLLAEELAVAWGIDVEAALERLETMLEDAGLAAAA